MPEGPTIKHMADRLRNALIGQVITAICSRYRKAQLEDWQSILPSRRIEGVRSHGKSLFIDLSGGYTIYSHMLMWGSWHLYEPGEEWSKPEKLARLVLQTPHKVAVLFNAPLCDLIPPNQLENHKTSKLGPDLLAKDFDKAKLWKSFQSSENSQREVGEILLDQNALSGIGNILKSEILFRAGLHPQKPVSSLTENQFNDLIECCLVLIRNSYEEGMRKTFIPDFMRPAIQSFGFVYRRRNSPCHLCQTPIEMVRQGEMQRSTYYCPICQPMEGNIVPFEIRLKTYLANLSISQ